MIRTVRVPLFVVTIELLAVLPALAANGSLKVTSFPSGATVAVDGANTGNTTPMSISLPVGTHVVKVQIPGSGWAPAESTVTVVAGNNDLSVTLLPTLTQGPEGPIGPQGPQGDPGIQGPPGTVTHAALPCFDVFHRYVNCGNGTVTDTVTGLIWLKDANCFGQQGMDYPAANQAAAGLADGQCGLTDGSSPGDWRLPTKAEWQATIAHAVALGCTDPGSGDPPSLTHDYGFGCLSEGPTSFTGVQLHYWSSSTSEEGAGVAWIVNLEFGTFDNFQKFNWIFPWPVRGGR